MKQQSLFEGAGQPPSSTKFITSFRIALVRDRPLPFGQPTLNNSRDAQALVKTLIETMGQSDREQLVVILLNSKNEMVGVNLVGTGGSSQFSGFPESSFSHQIGQVSCRSLFPQMLCQPFLPEGFLCKRHQNGNRHFRGSY